MRFGFFNFLTKNIGYIGIKFAVLSSLLISAGHAYAGEKENEIIARMSKAYGGERLSALKGITIYDNYKQLYIDQGVRADETEVFKNNIELTIDFEHNRKSLIEWESKERGTRLTQTIFDGEVTRIYDLYHKTFARNEQFQFSNLAAHIVRLHDTLLAKLAIQEQKTASYVGQSNYRNEIHDKLSINMTSNMALLLHVNRATGLISKMTRTHARLGEIASIFSNHKTTQGITYAADLQLNVAGNPELISVSRAIDVNPNLTHAFAAPTNFRKRGETIDSSQMTVKTLAPNVYFAGQGHAFSLFVDAGTHFIAVGGNRGLAARFAAVQSHANVNKPLKLQVVTHHHSDHLVSMEDARTLGAQFITVDKHVASIQKAVKQEIAQDRFILLDQYGSFAQGEVEIYDVPSTHSEHNLMVYVPKAKLMFVADHFSTDLKSGLPNVDKGTLVLWQAISKLKLDVTYLLGAHGSRILSYTDLEKVVQQDAQPPCPNGLTICRL